MNWNGLFVVTLCLLERLLCWKYTVGKNYPDTGLDFYNVFFDIMENINYISYTTILVIRWNTVMVHYPPCMPVKYAIEN